MDLTGDGIDPITPKQRPRQPWRQREASRKARVAFLDPAKLPPGGADVFPTAYEADVLLVSPKDPAGIDQMIEDLNTAASALGWTVTREALEAPLPEVKPGDGKSASGSGFSPQPTTPRGTGATDAVRARIAVDPAVNLTAPVLRPDAWALLQAARKANIQGVSLNHVLSVDSAGVNPFTGNPFTGNPFTGNPFTGNPFTGNPFTGNPAGGVAGYAYPGFGGRQPVYFAGPAPLRSTTMSDAERPVVAVLDTGCGRHPWFTPGTIIDPVREYGDPIGVVDPDSDPEEFPSLGDPLDGLIDHAAGHGTFIAGIILQACPDARVLPVRVSDAEGVIMENDLIAALGRIVTLVEGGTRIDVMNLSFSYYHESPDPAAVNDEIYRLLKKIRQHGTVVVCSAGNEATDRPASPAALYAWEDCDFGITAADETGFAPQQAVGALNPSGGSVALFSNVGDWVSVYARGVSILSTTPAFEGGAQADVRRDEYGKRRETLDIDDLCSGFAVWSGTSFAAPLVAGRIAQVLVGTPAPAIAGLAGPSSYPAAKAEAVAEVIATLAKDDKSAVPN